jgi:hypothetical protein
LGKKQEARVIRLKSLNPGSCFDFFLVLQFTVRNRDVE